MQSETEMKVICLLLVDMLSFRTAAHNYIARYVFKHRVQIDYYVVRCTRRGFYGSGESFKTVLWCTAVTFVISTFARDCVTR